METLEERQLLHAGHVGPHGLHAAFFDKSDFTDLRLSRTIRKVNLDYADRSPARRQISPDQFSIRLRGTLLPSESRRYTLHLKADDHAKLWIDGKPRIDTRRFAEGEGATRRLRLNADRAYSIRIDYVELAGGASLRLMWSAPGQKKRLIGTSHLLPPAPKPVEPPPPDPEPNPEPEPPPIPPGTWESKASMPVALGEVAGGIIGSKLYLIGEGHSATLSYDLAANTWSSLTAHPVRPFVGHHHAAEVHDGKLYVIGGFAGGSAGKVQIFDPSQNRWTTGASMPFAVSSTSSALIDGIIYVAGGIIGNATTRRAAKYDPQTNRWTEIAPMPQGRNHAAGGTDGDRFYIFGGRGPGSGDSNMVANGFDTVQIYDPRTNRWETSADASSGIAPLPQARGGMGKAVFASGEFYVMGGETASGAGATSDGVYARMDIYSPEANSWRLGTPMPTARHGIFPLLIDDRIYVAGGGTRAGFSSSSIVQVFYRG